MPFDVVLIVVRWRFVPGLKGNSRQKSHADLVSAPYAPSRRAIGKPEMSNRYIGYLSAGYLAGEVPKQVTHNRLKEVVISTRYEEKSCTLDITACKVRMQGV
jgi:hypothetical protein